MLRISRVLALVRRKAQTVAAPEQWSPRGIPRQTENAQIDDLHTQVPPSRTSQESFPFFSRKLTSSGRKQPVPDTVKLLEEDLNAADGTTVRDAWSPLVLRRKVVWSFFVAFSLLAILLGALQGISTSHNGLARVNTNHYYLWTYGPTVTFVILSALWGQVENRISQLLPWHLMSHDYVPASDSVLLDYISMWNVLALFKSIKRRHFVVTIVVAVSLIIKLIIAFSTSLFAINLVQINERAEFRLGTAFDSSAFNASAVDAGAFMRSWGVMRRGLSHPVGTSNDYAFQTFYVQDEDQSDSPRYLTDQLYTSTVDVFTPQIKCQEAIAITSSSSTNVTLQTSNCEHQFTSQTNQFWHLTLAFAIAPCNARTPGTTGNRIWVSLAQETDAGNGQSVAEWEEPNGTTRGVLHINVVALMCTAHYSISHARVDLMGTSDKHRPVPTVTDIQEAKRVFPNVTASEILTAAYRSVSRAAASYGTGTDTERFILLDVDPSTISTIFSPESLEQRLSQNINGVMIQVANDHLTRQSVNKTEGTIIFTENRLVLRSTTVVVVTVLLVVAALLLLVFIFLYIPFTACPKDPGSIDGFAALLFGSHSFTSTLTGAGSSTGRSIRRLLMDQYYTTATTAGVFYIKQKPTVSDPGLVDTTLSWWQPASTSTWAYATIVLLPIIIISIIEALFRRSTTAHGLGNASDNLFVGSLPGLIPALALLGVRSVFEVIHFNARIFEPYRNLKKGGASPATSIWDNHYRSIAALGLWTALRKRQWAVVASAMAVLLGPMLAIVVSSLFTISPTIMQHGISVTQLNRLNISQGGLFFSVESQDAWLGDLILEFNSSYPTWTYQEWSFPQVEVMQQDMVKINTTQDIMTSNETFITVRVPAVRFDMGCSEISLENIHVEGWTTFETSGSSEGDVGRSAVNFTSLPNLELSECKYDEVKVAIDYPGPSSYFDSWVTSPDAYAYVDELTPNTCPGFVGIFGRTSPGTPKVENMTLIGCRPRVEQAVFNVDMWLSDYGFNPANPPLPVPESTVILWDKFWDSGNISVIEGNSTEIKYLGPNLVLEGPDALEKWFVDIDIKDPITRHLSRALRSVIYGVNPTPVEDLLNADVLISSLNRNIGILTGQVLNKFGREKYTDDDTTTAAIRTTTTTMISAAATSMTTQLIDDSGRPVYPATLNFPSNPRIIQQKTTTRVLQSILAIMSLCGLISVLLMDTRAVLPKNPLSIAAQASLLADSKILKRLNFTTPPESQRHNNKQLQYRGVLGEGGRTYSMGWWDHHGRRIHPENEGHGPRNKHGSTDWWWWNMTWNPLSLLSPSKGTLTTKRSNNVPIEETELIDLRPSTSPHASRRNSNTMTSKTQTSRIRRGMYFAIDSDD